MKKYLLFIIILVVFSISFYWLGQQRFSLSQHLPTLFRFSTQLPTITPKVISPQVSLTITPEVTESPATSQATQSDQVQIPTPTTALITYQNSKYHFSFDYPASWQILSQSGDNVSFTNIKPKHFVGLWVMDDPIGANYCFEYEPTEDLIVAGKVAELASGTARTETTTDCDDPDQFKGMGNTYVLIPLGGSEQSPTSPYLQISVDYPVEDVNLAHDYLVQILDSLSFDQ